MSFVKTRTSRIWAEPFTAQIGDDERLNRNGHHGRRQPRCRY